VTAVAIEQACGLVDSLLAKAETHADLPPEVANAIAVARAQLATDGAEIARLKRQADATASVLRDARQRAQVDAISITSLLRSFGIE
jgi:hypothetical protein